MIAPGQADDTEWRSEPPAQSCHVSGLSKMVSQTGEAISKTGGGRQQVAAGMAGIKKTGNLRCRF
jgi:hypothetical protein